MGGVRQDAIYLLDVPLDSSYMRDTKLENKTFFVTFPFHHDESKHPSKRMRFWPGIEDGYANKIVAVTQNNDNTYYYVFLSNGRILHFNRAKNQVVADEEVSKSWKGIRESDSKKIMAVVLNHDKTLYWFFLNDGRRLRFNITRGEVDPEVQATKEWGFVPDSYAKNISGVAYHERKSKYYIFLNNGHYLKYQIGQKERGELSRETGKDWPELSPYSRHIVAVTRDGYIFISMKNGLYGSYNSILSLKSIYSRQHIFHLRSLSTLNSIT